jgi:hypothetical protein
MAFNLSSFFAGQSMGNKPSPASPAFGSAVLCSTISVISIGKKRLAASG